MITHEFFSLQPARRSGRRAGADQVIEGAQRGLGALAHGNHDLLVRHGGHVTGGEDAGDRRFTTLIDTISPRGDSSMVPLSHSVLGKQADLHEDTLPAQR
jgi:hypothetical protein